MSILAEIGDKATKRYILRCAKHARVDKAALYHTILTTKKGLKAPQMVRLEHQWYESLKTGTPDYSVYGDPFYFCDVWMCWITYSRKYLRAIRSPKAMGTRSVVKDLTPITKTVIDLGCGFGYTTAALKEMFKHARVIGTNLPNTAQFNMASELGSAKGFSVTESCKGINADIVWATEYFEHHQRPIEHLQEVLAGCSPQAMLIANTFTSPAIGHFDTYIHHGHQYRGRDISRMFNKEMQANGFTKVKTNCWNAKPTYWRRA